MAKRGQSSLEYLSTYGFMFAALVIIMAALWQMHVFDVYLQPRSTFGNTNFKIIDWAVSNNDGTTLANRFQITMQSLTDETVSISKVELSRQGAFCGSSNFSSPVSTRKIPLLVAGGMANCTTDDQDYVYDVAIFYIGKSGIDHTDRGRITGRFERLGDLIKLDNWRVTNFGSSPLNNDNGGKIGSYGGTCPAQVPDFSSLQNASTNYITWSVPGACSDTGQLTGVGFSNAVCSKVATYLSHGWLATRVWASPAYADKHLFLGGQATYTTGGQTRAGYICVNDNFHFYVNGQVLFRGGTTGLLGTEVVRQCDANSCADSDGWCIPPVEISAASGFNFGDYNDVAILLEDYCTSGGIRIPSFYFV